MIKQTAEELENKKKGSKEKIKKARLKGFAKTIATVINAAQKINEEKVKELIKGKRSITIFNPKDGDWAALITIENDQINVEGIQNSLKEVLKRKYLLWWGYVEAKTDDFMNYEMSQFKWFIRMITFRAKLRGIPHVQLVRDIINSATMPKSK